ncbi:MAG: hypothetical protein AB1744_16400, partial [Candidatus Zixiibacteriota bacterium]
VLQLARDVEKRQDYVQLISEDATLTANVMVRIPELNMEVITNHQGFASLEDITVRDPHQLTWQLKLPEAVFSLEPLTYDPNRTEYAKEVELHTDWNDRITVTFEGKTEGKRILIRILELDGRADFGHVRVQLSQRELSHIRDAEGNETIAFDLTDEQDTINIRLFQ